MTEGFATTPLPGLDELQARAHVVSLPTRTRFRGISVREALLFAGPKRWSEFSPFPEYAPAEASAWLAAALEYGWGTLPPRHRDTVPVNATVPAVAPDEVAPVLERFNGCTTVKVKVAEAGQSLRDDIARVRRVRELMGPDARVRVDANAAWSVSEAVTALTALADFDLDYAEQPCASVDELARVRARLAELPDTPMRIAADESVRKASDPLAVARAGAADLLVVKAQPLGGVHRALEVIGQAGLPVVVSSALDTSVGIAMGTLLAAALPEGVLAGACGLGTVELLAGDVAAPSLVPERGVIPVGDPTVAPALLEEFRAPAEREAWWRARLAQCYALLVS